MLPTAGYQEGDCEGTGLCPTKRELTVISAMAHISTSSRRPKKCHTGVSLGPLSCNKDAKTVSS